MEARSLPRNPQSQTLSGDIQTSMGFNSKPWQLYRPGIPSNNVPPITGGSTPLSCESRAFPARKVLVPGPSVLQAYIGDDDERQQLVHVYRERKFRQRKQHGILKIESQTV